MKAVSSDLKRSKSIQYRIRYCNPIACLGDDKALLLRKILFIDLKPQLDTLKYYYM